MPYMYILRCADGSFYVGSTWDLDKRLWEHNEGLGAAYTRIRRPVVLVYCEVADRIDDAYRREKQVQGWGRAKRLALINGATNELPGLSRNRQQTEVSTGSTSERDGQKTEVSTGSTSERDGQKTEVSTGSTSERDGQETEVSTGSTSERDGQQTEVSTGSTREGGARPAEAARPARSISY